MWNQLHLKQDILYCISLSPTGAKLCDQVVVPAALRPDISKELHEGTLSGHLGTENTLGKLKEHFYWPGHYNVREWCQKCALFAARKTPTPKPRPVLVHVSISAPLELIAMDTLDPLPDSNSYILVGGDYFTKWMEAYFISN